MKHKLLDLMLHALAILAFRAGEKHALDPENTPDVGPWFEDLMEESKKRGAGLDPIKEVHDAITKSTP